MMGGLKTITDTNGNVTFADSRVFFGKEKMLFSTALSVYNTTNDPTLRATIYSEHIDGNANVEAFFDQAHVIVTVSPITTAPTPTPAGPGEQTGKYYYKSSGASYQIWIWSGTAYVEQLGDNLPKRQFRLLSGGTDVEVNVPARISMLELGFTPTFYQFVDTIIEVKINISFTEERASEVNTSLSSKVGNINGSFNILKGKASVGRSVTTSQVNASFSSKFSYTAEGSSLLRTKLTPIPPPAILEDRIRDLMEVARQEQNPSN
jgi:hypothetical protein